MNNIFKHWDKIYQEKNHKKISWHQEQSTLSYKWILEFTKKNEPIIDVGCGVSILSDELIDAGYTNISLLEISTSAIKTLKNRLKNDYISFYNENILEFKIDKTFQLWHDRAVFHFLTNNKERDIYLKKLNKYLKVGGYFLLATFAINGPKKCSELNIVQYDKKKIKALLINNFELIKTESENHPHPNGTKQKFNYFLLKKIR